MRTHTVRSDDSALDYILAGYDSVENDVSSQTALGVMDRQLGYRDLEIEVLEIEDPTADTREEFDDFLDEEIYTKIWFRVVRKSAG